MKNKSTKTIIILAAMLVLSIVFSTIYNKKNPKPVSQTQIYFDTVISITIYDGSSKSLIDECMKKCAYYENIFSKTKHSSELYKLNNRLLTPYEETESSITYEVSDDLAAIIERGLYYCKLSDGKFDITIEPLSGLWNFKENTDSPVIPSKQDIMSATSKVNYQNISLSGNHLTFTKNESGNIDTTLDLGAIAKGYIADELKSFLVAEKCTSALINLGGNILCVGEKDTATPFSIGIQTPFSTGDDYIKTMELKDVSVVTSGSYQRYFKVDNTIYHHLLNPKTGYPYDTGLNSVTIISEKSVDGDALSTICFALGIEDAKKLIESLDNISAVFVTDKNKVIECN